MKTTQNICDVCQTESKLKEEDGSLGTSFKYLLLNLKSQKKQTQQSVSSWNSTSMKVYLCYIDWIWVNT